MGPEIDGKIIDVFEVAPGAPLFPLFNENPQLKYDLALGYIATRLRDNNLYLEVPLFNNGSEKIPEDAYMSAHLTYKYLGGWLEDTKRVEIPLNMELEPNETALLLVQVDPWIYKNKMYPVKQLRLSRLYVPAPKNNAPSINPYRAITYLNPNNVTAVFEGTHCMVSYAAPFKNLPFSPIDPPRFVTTSYLNKSAPKSALG